MGRDPLIAGVDIGGTKVAVACVSGDMEVQALRLAPTVTGSAEACFERLCEEVEALIADAGPVDAIGVGTASMVDYPSGRIVESTHLPLRDFALRDELRRRFELPVAIDNDATVACIAEHRFGAGRGTRDMLMLTLGTGIGGGIIAAGQPYRGFSGAAGELGHMVIEIDGPPCSGSCPGRGCLEALVSGSVLDRRAEALAAAGSHRALADAAAAGETVDGVLLTRLAHADDPAAVAVYEEVGGLLGIGIVNLVNIFNPQLVVVGGSVSEAGDLLLEPARRVVARRALIPQRDQVRIVAAQFRAHAGVIGAAALAYTELLESG
jgi:glucokinase